ncbi:MAG: hypothetical protein ABWY66_07960 [Xanthobacteraceae bacterium]|jgi:hypothetical protein
MFTQSNTQVYSPLGSYVVERRAGGDERRFEAPTPAMKATEAAQFEMADVPSQRKAGDVLSNEQAAVGLRLQRYFLIHGVSPTPSRLQMLLNQLMGKAEVGVR